MKQEDKNSNTVAFVEQLTANQRKIFAYIMSLVVNVNDADDILQETVKMMWKKYEQFVPGTDFLAWATTIAHYRVIEFRRQKSRSKVVFDDKVFDSIQNQAMVQIKDTDDYLVYLRQCVKKLQANDISMIKMRYASGCTFKEMASDMGRTLQSVHRSIARIQGLLRHCINRQIASEARR